MTQLASNGVVLQCIHYSSVYATKAALKSDPGKTIVAAAKALAAKLSAITGAAFNTIPLDPTAGASSGIVLGLPADFARDWPSWPEAVFGTDPMRAEHYFIDAHADGVRIVGASALAVQHAVWDLLHRIGYRQYFPSPTWEVVPSIRELSVDINVWEAPDFLDRYYWGGHGQWEETEDRIADWRAKNRMARGFKVNAGNGGYESIIGRNREALAINPDYWALVGNVRQTGGTKFCTANPGLRRVVVNDVFGRFANAATTSQSLEASDVPTGFCECEGTRHDGVYYPGCNKLFGMVESLGRAAITNRVVSLANAAAAATRELYPDRTFLIGMLAYSTHSDPPTIDIDPNVSVGFSTDYNGGRNTPALMLEWMRQWASKGSKNGALSDYWSNTDQHWDLPGRGAASHGDFLETTVVPYYRSGLRFLSAEANYNFGPSGLGYWLASRVLWRTDDVTCLDELREDFFQNCFGAGGPACVAAARAFYKLIDGAVSPAISTHLIGSMYRCLQDGLKATTNAAVRARLYDLVLYTRWVELVRHRENSKGTAASVAKSFETLMRWAHRIRFTEMIHGCALWRGESDKIPVETSGVAGWQDPNHSWKSDRTFARGGYTVEDILEIAGPNGDGTVDDENILAAGVINNPLVTSWTPRVFAPEDLIPVPQRMWTPGKYYNTWGSYSYITSEHSFYVWIDAPGAVQFTLTSGISAPKPASFALVELVDYETGAVVSSGSAPNDALPHDIVLTAQRAGLHRLVVKPGHRVRAKLDWAKGLRVTLNYGFEKEFGQYRYIYRTSQYFYVPKGTSVLGIYYAIGGNKLESPAGAQYTFVGTAGDYASITVPPGQDGTFWRFVSNPGTRLVMNAPQFYARHPSEMLLPREVIEKDWP